MGFWMQLKGFLKREQTEVRMDKGGKTLDRIRWGPWDAVERAYLAGATASAQIKYGFELVWPTRTQVTTYCSKLWRGAAVWVSTAICYTIGFKGHLIHPDMMSVRAPFQALRRQLQSGGEHARWVYEQAWAMRLVARTGRRPEPLNRIFEAAEKLDLTWVTPTKLLTKHGREFDVEALTDDGWAHELKQIVRRWWWSTATDRSDNMEEGVNQVKQGLDYEASKAVYQAKKGKWKLSREERGCLRAGLCGGVPTQYRRYRAGLEQEPICHIAEKMWRMRSTSIGSARNGNSTGNCSRRFRRPSRRRGQKSSGRVGSSRRIRSWRDCRLNSWTTRSQKCPGTPRGGQHRCKKVAGREWHRESEGQQRMVVATDGAGKYAHHPVLQRAGQECIMGQGTAIT